MLRKDGDFDTFQKRVKVGSAVKLQMLRLLVVGGEEIWQNKPQICFSTLKSSILGKLSL